MRLAARVGVLLGVLVGLIGGGAAASKDDCRDIRGSIVTELAPGDCASPVGLCFRGRLETNSVLQGDTFFVARAVMPLDEAGTQLAYTGTLTVVLPGGDRAIFESAGTVDALAGIFSEEDIWTPEGLRRSALRAFVSLRIEGTTANLSGFEGRVKGQLCGSKEAGR